MIPKWIQVALGELGVKEIRGSQHSPRVLEYHADTGLGATTDEVPWCGSFVAWCLDEAGIDISKIRSHAAGARQWAERNYGKELKEPIPGALLILKRGKYPSGHITFFLDWVDKAKTRMRCIGGNQNNAVTIAEYPVSQLIESGGVRWPPGVPIPVADQPLSKSGVIRGAGLAGAGTVTVLVESAPEITRALNDADSQWSQGTILSFIAGLIVLGALAWVIYGRIKGKKDERKITEGLA